MTDNRNQRAPRGRDAVTYTDYRIFAGDVKLVFEDGRTAVMDRDDAIEMAHAEGKNLVQVAYVKSSYPRSVCKILDYSKYRYEQKKREKEVRRAQREANAELKEIKFSIRIDDGDRAVKMAKVRQILGGGDKVKLTIRLSRREMQRSDLARELMRGILAELDGLAEMDTQPTFVGNTVSCTIRGK